MRYCLFLAIVWLCTASSLAGTVEGTVEVREPTKVRRTPGTERYGPGGLKAPATAAKAKGSESENVVISVLDLVTPVGPCPKVSIGQVNKAFVPHVTAIRTGTTVDFPNGDKIFHSVYSESAPQKFHLPEYPQGQARSVTFSKPGHIELFCAIHAHMNAHILVLPNEYFGKADSQGKFRLKNLPAGKLKLQAWHPKLGAQVLIVEVPKEGTVQANFVLK